MAFRFDESHPALKGFNSFYEREIAPGLAAMEGGRKKAVKHVVLLAAGGLPAGALLFLAGDIGIFAGIVVIGFTVFLAKRRLSEVSGNVKVHVVGKVCAFLGLSYRPEPDHSPLPAFEALGLLPPYDRCHLEDEMQGEHDGVGLHFLEVTLTRRRTRTRAKGGTRTEHVTVFQGLLMGFAFAKPFSGRTAVVQDKGWLGKIFDQGGRGERVALEDPRFESVFEVYSDDQVEARYLLTPGFMERLLELSQRFGAKSLSLGFIEQSLLIALRRPGNQFEGGSMFGPLADPRRVQELLKEIGVAYDIVDILQLQLKTRA